MNSSVHKDVSKHYLGAVEAYELDISANILATVETFSNLAFLYWSFAFQQIEFNIPNNIPDEWSNIGGIRYKQIIDKGLMYHPTNIELNFWKQYYPHISYGDEFSEQDCENLFKQYDNTSNVPYFFLNFFDKQKYVSRIIDLMAECSKVPTAKNLYIQSVVNYFY